MDKFLHKIKKTICNTYLKVSYLINFGTLVPSRNIFFRQNFFLLHYYSYLTLKQVHFLLIQLYLKLFKYFHFIENL